MACELNNLLCCMCFTALFVPALSANFCDTFQAYWGSDHIVADKQDPSIVTLSLDNSSGCGFGSKKKYMFGQISMLIKLVPGDSAGVVTAFYMSSDGPNHNELDLEFLGNVSGEPYLVQTNIYVNGSGNREQRHSLWFDPTTDFHTYSMFWNRQMIRFLIDGIPVRVFSNQRTSKGIPYPKDQAMGIYASIWNADDWATQGGLVKTNWSHAPFVTAFKSFMIDACEVSPEDDAASKCDVSGAFRWDTPAMNGLSPHQRRQLKWARAKHLVYDYCKDTARFTELPKECST